MHVLLILLHEVVVSGSSSLAHLLLVRRRDLVGLVASGLADRLHVLRYDVVFADHRLLGLTLLGAKSTTLASQIVGLLPTLWVLTRSLLHAINVAIEGVVVTAAASDVQTHIVVLAHIAKFRFLSCLIIVERLDFGGEGAGI